MSSDYAAHRNRLIAGLALLLVLLILVVYLLVRFVPRGNDDQAQSQVGQRSPLAGLTYCGSVQDKLCIVSFAQEVDGAMQINFQTPHASFPEFILQIIHDGEENTYECEEVEDASTSIQCTGASQVPGQVLQFKVISKHRGTLLAEGKFAIIGIALVTPDILTGTVDGLTGTPTGTATAVSTLRTPTPTRGTPTPTATTPSPSYPNPSYP